MSFSFTSTGTSETCLPKTVFLKTLDKTRSQLGLNENPDWDDHLILIHLPGRYFKPPTYISFENPQSFIKKLRAYYENPYSLDQLKNLESNRLISSDDPPESKSAPGSLQGKRLQMIQLLTDWGCLENLLPNTTDSPKIDSSIYHSIYEAYHRAVAATLRLVRYAHCVSRDERASTEYHYLLNLALAYDSGGNPNNPNTNTALWTELGRQKAALMDAHSPLFNPNGLSRPSPSALQAAPALERVPISQRYSCTAKDSGPISVEVVHLK